MRAECFLQEKCGEVTQIGINKNLIQAKWSFAVNMTERRENGVCSGL